MMQEYSNNPRYPEGDAYDPTYAPNEGRFALCSLCGATVKREELSKYDGFCEVCHLFLEAQKGERG